MMELFLDKLPNGLFGKQRGRFLNGLILGGWIAISHGLKQLKFASPKSVGVERGADGFYVGAR